MCGIGGIVRITPPGETHEPIPEAWIDTLDAHIEHRGPDGCGTFRDRVTREDGTIVEILLVHRRLSIIDHAGGAQPMVSEQGLPRSDGSTEGLIAIVFNGCIYNHRDLRAPLEQRGRVFASDHSDTEVIIHAYREWFSEGSWSQFDDRLNGMYSLALWDRDAGSLHLAIDASQKKPMYVRLAPDIGIGAFASTAAALASLDLPSLTDSNSWADHPSCRRDFERAVLVDWIVNGYSGSGMPLIGVTQLPDPSWDCRSCDLIDLLERWQERNPSGTKMRLHHWILVLLLGPPFLVFIMILWLTFLPLFLIWCLCSLAGRHLPEHINRREPPQLRGIADADEAEALLDGAVARRLEADVPLGCFLSGGIDSSLVSLLAHRHLGDLTTICVRMPDERYDESEFASAIAEVIGTNHLTIDCQPNPANDLVMLIEQLGLPFGDSSLLPTYWVSKAAREHVKVALSGDGGDELFCGYERYRAAPHLRWLRLIAWAIPISRYDRSDPKSREDKLARLITAGRHKGYNDLISIFPTPDRRAMLSKPRGYLTSRRIFGSVEVVRQMDFGSYLPNDLLRKVDTASMAVGLEVRCPFMDRDLRVAAENTPIRRLMPRGELKGLLKRVARKHFPAELVDRPKMGFAIPIGEWFRTDYGGMRTLMMDLLGSAEPFGIVHQSLDVNMEAVRRIIEEHMACTRDHSQRLFVLTSLAIWARWHRGVV